MNRYFPTLAAAAAAVVLSALGSAQAAPFRLTQFEDQTGFKCDQLSSALVGCTPNLNDIDDDINWRINAAPTSSLVLNELALAPGVVLPPLINPDADQGWESVTSLTHNNIIIPGGTFTFSGRIDSLFELVDDDPPPAGNLVDGSDQLGFDFTETLNAAPCPGPNPVGSVCDDFFTVALAALTPLDFSADGEDYTLEFRFLAGPGVVVIPGLGDVTIFTAEQQSSTIFVQARVTQKIPEPTALLLVGTVLLGVGVARRHVSRQPQSAC